MTQIFLDYLNTQLTGFAIDWIQPWADSRCKVDNGRYKPTTCHRMGGQQ